MTLSKHVVRGENSTQREQKSIGTNVPTVKHTDLMKSRFQTPTKAPKETNPQKRVCPLCKSSGNCKCNDSF